MPYGLLRPTAVDLYGPGNPSFRRAEGRQFNPLLTARLTNLNAGLLSSWPFA
jgi:hypothetical protein